MMDLLQATTMLLLGAGVILNGLATRRLIKRVSDMNEVLRVVIFQMGMKS